MQTKDYKRTSLILTIGGVVFAGVATIFKWIGQGKEYTETLESTKSEFRKELATAEASTEEDETTEQES